MLMTPTVTAPVDHRAAIAALRQEALDDLLSRWDHWLHPVQVSRGYASTSAEGRLYRTSRQYDDENGALDDAVEHQVMQGVQACVEKLSLEHRIAIHVEARNVRLGVSVWRSPRLPANEAAAREVIQAARLALLSHLVRAGVVE
jgi:hypothetical protein